MRTPKPLKPGTYFARIRKVRVNKNGGLILFFETLDGKRIRGTLPAPRIPKPRRKRVRRKH
jgi:hypothetical protein